MANWASSKERFVEVPGVVEIRWESDDPDYYVKPTDLFDQQAKNEGLPDWYGKKDKATTEQAFFTCNVCECDLKSVVTLRAHCKGTQHIRKALQKKKEYRDAQKKLKKKDETTEEVTTKVCKTLFECLELTSETAVGLENITEYKSSSEPNKDPFYHCNLQDCFNDQGGCQQMARHIMVARHKQNWLHAKTGQLFERSSEISQEIAKYVKGYERDWRTMRTISDDELWRKCKRGLIRVERKKEERRTSENDERRSSEKEERRSWEKEEERSREREERTGGRSRVRDEREERRSWKREGSHDKERDYKRRSRSRETPSRNERDNKRYRSRSRERSSERWDRREVKPDRDVDRPRSKHDYRKEKKYSEERQRDRRDDDRGRRNYNDVDRTRDNGHVKREEGGSERTREHDDKGSERVDYRERRRDDDVRDSSAGYEAIASSSSQALRTEENQLDTSIQDAINTLHRKVADCVKKRLSMYLVGLAETEAENMKINDAEEYTKLAKDFSHKMRDQIKDTYEQYHRTMEGITLTPDNKEQIKMEIDMFFDRRAVIKFN